MIAEKDRIQFVSIAYQVGERRHMSGRRSVGWREE
jgi:hypothetical protein